MAIVQTWPTSATLTGAFELNSMHFKARQEDLGSKLEKVISNINDLNSTVSTIMVAVSNLNSALAFMAACAASFASALSAGGLSSDVASITTLSPLSGGAISNFRASHPA